MKKLLLSLGAIASVAAPVAAVVACGATDGDKSLKSNKTEAQLNVLTADQVDAPGNVKEVEDLFGITTGLAPAGTDATKVKVEGAKYKDGVLTFNSGTEESHKLFTFNISPATKADMPTLANGKKALVVYRYNFTEDMSPFEFTKWQSEFAHETNDWLNGPDSGDDTKTRDERKAIEDAWYKSNYAPLFILSYKGKTVEVDFSLGDDVEPAKAIMDARKAMQTSLETLGTKLTVSNPIFDIA